MTDTEIPDALRCAHCEGRGYVGNAYWDEELEWYIFSTTGSPCEHCEGSGAAFSNNMVLADMEETHSAMAS